MMIDDTCLSFWFFFSRLWRHWSIVASPRKWWLSRTLFEQDTPFRPTKKRLLRTCVLLRNYHFILFIFHLSLCAAAAASATEAGGGESYRSRTNDLQTSLITDWIETSRGFLHPTAMIRLQWSHLEKLVFVTYKTMYQVFQSTADPWTLCWV